MSQTFNIHRKHSYAGKGVCCFFYPEYESDFGIDHCRIVDLLQVFDISPTIDVWITGNQWLSLKVAASREPDCTIDHHL